MLPGRLATLMRLRHGLSATDPMTMMEIAEALSMTQEDVEAGIRSAMRLTRAGLLESQMRSTHGEDEAICQIETPSLFTTSIRPIPAFVAERVFAKGVIAGTHVLVDTPDKAAVRARAAEASDRMDPDWLVREQRRFLDVRAEKLATAARRRAALAAASAVATRAALDTPTLSIGLKPDEDEMRFAVYAFDGRGSDGGSSLLMGAFLTPSEMEMRYDDLKRELLRYKDRRVDGARRRRVA